MPILNDILDHDVIGPEYRRGIQEGHERGREQGVQEGLQQGELKILRRLIEKRFGTMPTWAEESLAHRTEIDLEELGVRALDAESLEDLLR